MDSVAFFSIFCVFIAAPSIVFGFLFLNKRNKLELEKLRYRKEILELELAKEETHLKALDAESRHYDRLIQDGKPGSSGA